MTKIISFLVISSVILLSCESPCTNSHISPAFVGFQKTDIDTFVIRAFKANDNYLHLIDTIVVVNVIGLASIYTEINDTTIVYVNDSDPNKWIISGQDWQIYIPAKNRTISISNIIDLQTDGSSRGCWNPIISFMLDSQKIIPTLFSTDDFFTSGYRVYIYN